MPITSHDTTTGAEEAQKVLEMEAGTVSKQARSEEMWVVVKIMVPFWVP